MTRTKQVTNAKKVELHSRIEELKDALQSTQRAFLEACGWDYSSNYPGAFWLWSKKDDQGHIITADTGLAISMETCGYGFTKQVRLENDHDPD